MRTPTSLLALLALGACAPMDDPAGAAPDPDLDLLAVGDYAPDRVIVGFADGEPLRAVLDGTDLGPVRSWSSIRAAAFEVPAGRSPLDAVRALRATGRYAWVEPDYVRHATATATDPYYGYQWHFDAIDLETAWDHSTGAGAVVAVIDSGLSTAGSDTPENLSAYGYDWVGDDTDPTDQNGHGTHVAGTIAQATNNGVGVAGIAYDAEIMVLRVLDRSGSGYTSDVVSAIEWAADHGADVINMSLGSSYYSSTEDAACAYAEDMGVAIFAAAGNDGGAGIDYPGAYDSVVAVGATDYNDVRAWYSDTGSQLDIMAPGGDTSVDANGDDYADGVLQQTFSGRTWGLYFFQGTSMATPHAAGVAALLIAAGASRADARDCLEATADDLGSSGWDSTYGWGRIDAGAAMAGYLAGTCGEAPVDADGDGWTTGAGDCDDADPAVYPGAPDTWYDGVDSDCAGDSDYDADADGYDSDDWSGTDCDDTDDTVYPGAPEIPLDGIDQDCDGEDAAADTTPPVVSGVSDTYTRSKLRVRFTTDEPATGYVLTDTGVSDTTTLGSSHDTGSFRAPGATTYTITVTDEAGNVATYGPYTI